jgi:prepilin-type N-terminal cleavage/methylation domain-containing protein
MKLIAVKSRGFTIVELLIVVVVIAILATIAIVSYTGIQEKAWNSKALANVSTFEKLLKSYASINGTYPNYSAWTICLGTGYPDKNGDGAGDCVVEASGSVVASTINGADPLSSIAGSNNIRIGDGPYLQRPRAAPDNQYFVISAVRYVKDTSLYYNGVYNPDWLVYIIRGKGIDCRRPVANSFSDGKSYFVDVAVSSMKDDAWKECYEPLPPQA